MGVRPVDLQTTIARAPDAAQSQGQREAGAAAVQGAFATQLRQKAEHQQEAVQAAPQPGEAEVRPREGQGRGGGKGQGQPRGRAGPRPGARAPGAGAAPREPGKGTRLDVKL